MESGDNYGAISDYGRVIAINPGYVAAYANRGLAYGRAGEHAKAIADFDKALAIGPGDAKMYLSRGLSYYYGGEDDRAIADFDRSSPSAPTMRWRTAVADGLMPARAIMTEQ